MDFVPASEHRALADTARAYLARRFPAERVGELADSAAGWDPDSWTEIVKLGWLDPAVGAVGQAVLAEATGYALYPGPWWSTVGLAGGVLTGTAPATLAWAEDGVSTLDEAARAAGCRFDGTLSGEKTAVPDAALCDTVVVVAREAGGIGLYAAELAAAEVSSLSTVDSSRRLARVRFDRVPARRIVAPGEAGAVLAAVRHRSLALLAAE
ncbi:MAG TPA: acyl-CoA dehydrogenase, partial [Rugosimonospora sp.]|nr:acyl-CoA dehydrogenase [Rugosimonospora sp.]